MKRIVRVKTTQYPDIYLYDVLEVNPDAGKSGVTFSGDYLMVASNLDSKEEAYQIAALPELITAIKDMLAQQSGRYEEKSCGHQYYCNCPYDKAELALRLLDSFIKGK